MRKIVLLVITAVLVACTSSPSVSTSPAPSATPPSTPTSEKPSVSSGSWMFAYAPGTYSYKIKNEAEVEAEGESPRRSEREDRVTIAVASDGAITVVEPAAVAGASGCQAPEAALRARAVYLLPKLPSQLNSGATWSDSVETSGCFRTASTNTIWLHNYVVEGETKFEGYNTVLVRRNSKVAGKGNVIEGQHNLLINATGVDSASFFVEPTTGKLLGSISNQAMDIVITASGQGKGFKQRAKQIVTVY